MPTRTALHALGTAAGVSLNTFTAALSANGLFPATHYVSAGRIDAAIGAVLTNAAMLYGACQQAGLTVTLVQCEDLVARSDVSEENPQAVFERVGLVLCQESI